MNIPILNALVFIAATYLIVLMVFTVAILILQFPDKKEVEKMAVTAKSLNAIFEDWK